MASRLPVRWRLTLWYLALFASVLTIFAAGLYVGLRYFLYDSLDATLRSQAALTLASLEVPGDTPRLADHSLTNPREGEQVIRVADASGRIIADTGGGAGNPLDQAGLSAALSGATDLRWVLVDGDRLRVLSQPIESAGRVVGAVQIGVFENEITEVLRITLGLIGALGPLSLVGAGLGGAWFARRALEPVDRMTALAASIQEHDLAKRLTPPAANDELGRLARTFNAMLDRIEGAFQRQRRFTADASHELRTPLALMQSQIDLALSRERDPAEDREVLEALSEDLSRLVRISHALLTLARSDVERLELVREDVDLAALLELVVEQYQSLAESGGVTLALETAPVRVMADEDRLIQVLVNLIDNALRHTPPGKQVTLGCRAAEDSALFWVADQGTGILPEHLPHVFDRFYRAESGRDRSRGGAGLGLSICKTIVEVHGGSITVTSQPGMGTTVAVQLPLRTAG